MRLLLAAFARAERPAAWLLLIGGAVTFVGVLFDLIATGAAKWATLLVAADLMVSGFGTVQNAHDDELSSTTTETTPTTATSSPPR